MISESGASYTWSENAHEFRLTPWHNDPVCDSSGETFYIRDEENGHYWSPTPFLAVQKPYIIVTDLAIVLLNTLKVVSLELWVYVFWMLR